MIALTDPDDPNQLSGMPHNMARALRAQGVRVTPLVATDGTVATRNPLAARIARAHRRRSPQALKKLLDNLFPGPTVRAFRRRSEALAQSVTAQLAQIDTPESRAAGEAPDLLFGVCIATAIARLETDIPIVYFSDATSPIINATYPAFAERGEALKQARQNAERDALARVTRAVFAAPATMQSALEHLGVPESRAHVVPMGAHVVPADPRTITAPAAPPTRRDCRLLVIAADPVRKRVDLAVRTAELLRKTGVHATLSVVGPGTPLARRSDAVDFVGTLRLSCPDDAQTHRALLRACHLQLLPSLGEAFGIAPAESAHFARPSIVSAAGGLPFVVLHDDTGIVMPVDAGPQQWAQAIARLVDDPARYRLYSAAALARARTKLTWSAWGASMVSIMHQTLAERQAATT